MSVTNGGMRFYDISETPLGWMGALATERGLRRTTLPRSTPDECLGLLGPEAAHAALDPDRFGPLRASLARYFSGEPEGFEGESLDIDGCGPFHKAAWAACQSIPYGETRTYRWLAEQAGSPNASRAAGQSMARNRLPIIVPCHRVVASDGALRGFGSGARQLDLKARLLALESGAKRAW